MNHRDSANPIIDNDSDRCLLYLLGELDKDAAKRFELDLAHSDDLHHKLLVQSELILALGQLDLSTGLPAKRVPGLATPSSLQLVRSWVIAIAAVAACMLIAIPSVRLLVQQQKIAFLSETSPQKSSNNHDESWQIAKAWAAGQLDSEIGEDEVFGPASDAVVDFTDEDSPIDLDLTLSWMTAAIASSPEMRSPEAQDG
jgi:hypothetical protein